MNESRELRVERNHALFREVNQRIFALTDDFGSRPADDGLSLAFVCECGNGTCVSQVLVDSADYARIRACSDQFVVAPGHEIGDLEHVVESNQRYVVVERAGAAV